MMNNFPYPVLTELKSAYLEECSFSVDFITSKIVNNEVRLILSLALKSVVLNSYIDNDEAGLFIKVKTDISSNVFDAQVHNGNIEVIIPQELFRSHDVLEITAYVYAKKPIVYLWNNEISSVYPTSLSIQLREKDVLAISNTVKLDYAVSSNDFIKFTVSNDLDDKGFIIKLSNENFIEIVIGPKLSHAYASTKSNFKISSIFSSHIVFETFVYVLVELVQQKADFEEKEWYRLFESLLNSITGDDVDQFIEKVRDADGYVDMSQIFEVAQKLINNQIENSLISVSKLEE